MLEPIVLPPLKVLLTLIGFPLLYLFNSFTPWSKGLFVQLARSHRAPFFVSIHILHWATTGCVIFWLQQNGNSAANLGLSLPHLVLAVFGFVAVGAAIAVTGGNHAATTYSPQLSADAPIYRRIVDLLTPKTRNERLAHVALCVTAGFCEEFLYRGFGILALLGLGCPAWAAVGLTSLSFALIHGRAAFSPMGFYWVVKGAFYGVVFLWSQSLLLVMGLHALWDLALLLRREKRNLVESAPL